MIRTSTPRLDSHIHTRPCRVLACANAADAVEVLAVGFFLTVYKTNSGHELTSGEKGMCIYTLYLCGGSIQMHTHT